MLIDSLTDYAVFAVSRAGSIDSWNRGAQRIFGYTQAEILGRDVALLFTVEDCALDAPAREIEYTLGGQGAAHDRWYVRRDGSRFWGTSSAQPYFDTAGVALGCTKLVRDTTENHVALQQLRDSEERLRMLIESVQHYAIFCTALDGRITSWNSGAQQTFGFSQSEVLGCELSVLFLAADIAAGSPDIELRTAAAAGYAAAERRLIRKNKSLFYASVKLSRLKPDIDGESRGFVVVAHDISELHERSNDMRRRASTDDLTKLANRAAFYEHLNRALASRKRHANVFAVLFIDLDRFKCVNDTFGHLVGDRLLEAIARRLESCARSEDIVARIGGDEFAILLDGINGSIDASDAAERIGVQMSNPFSIGGYTIDVTASVGVALAGPRHVTPSDLLRDADAAMYMAKSRGRARAVMFDAERGSSAAGGPDLTADLRHAVERGELRIAFQPLHALRSGRLTGFEALARWQHPRHGLLLPVDFIDHAEGSGAIIAIDRWILRQAVAHRQAWEARCGNGLSLTMSVNLSSKQFACPDLVADLRAAFAQAEIDPRCVHLEITETAALEQSESTRAVMAQLHDLGVKLHLDDFGTGYSTLASLAHLPVDALKIDRSFVTEMHAPRGAELVRTIVTLAHNFGIVAIAEGVESVEQLAALNVLGCESGQGAYFSPPLTAADAGAYALAAQETAAASLRV